MSRSIVQVRRKKKDTDRLRSAWHILEEWVEVNRRQILVIGGTAAALVVLFAVAFYAFDYRHQLRLAAHSAAFEKFTATVGPAPTGLPTPGAAKKTYETETAKYQDAAAAFEQLAADYSGYRDLGTYYAGICYLKIDPPKGVAMLEKAAAGKVDSSYGARLALAEHLSSSGDDAAAEKYYQMLSDDPGSLPRFYVLVRLGQVKERLNKPAEAAPLYKLVVDADRNSSFGIDAEKGLQRVDPKLAAALPPKTGPATGPAPNTAQMPGAPTIGLK